MASSSPTTHPPLLDLIAQFPLVTDIVKHCHELVTDPKYRPALPTEPDPAWTIRALACSGIFPVYLATYAPENSRVHKWLRRLFEKCGLVVVLVMQFVVLPGMFALAWWWPACVIQLVRLLEAILPSILHSATKFVLLEAPSTILWYLQFQLSPLKPVPNLALWSYAFALLTIFLLCTILIFAWPSLLVGGAWTIVYYELLCSRFPRFFQKRTDARRAAYVQRSVERHHAAQARRLEARQQLFNTLSQEDVLASVDLGQLGEAWTELVHGLSTYECWRCAEFYQEQVKGRQQPPPLAGTAAPLASLFKVHYLRKRQNLLASANYRAAAYELAGLISRYLLPLRGLRHLSRRFSLPRVLVILCGRPLLELLLWMRPSSWGLFTRLDKLDHPRYQPFLHALSTFHATPACQALQAPEALFEAYLKAVEAEDEAVQAEDVASEAILEALFRWKAVKKENKKRLKQD